MPAACASTRAQRLFLPHRPAFTSLSSCDRRPLQLLQLVVDHPNKSAVDLRFLSHIWEAFLRWCAMQFDARVGVKVLGMGEFCYRKDVIGEMEFFNPMFIMNERQVLRSLTG